MRRLDEATMQSSMVEVSRGLERYGPTSIVQ